VTLDRRTFVRDAGLGLLAFNVAGAVLMATPAQARKQRLPFQTLKAEEALTLEALGDVLVPGAKEAGLAHYVDQQLSGPHAESMLMINYLGVPPPVHPFYAAALGAINRASRGRFEKAFTRLNDDEAVELVQTMSKENPAGWEGPPAPFFYFVLRSDALDVRYGTEKGFADLGIPYMAHIKPPSAW